MVITTSTRRWRRTALTRADGPPVPDDCSLIDDRFGGIARIYRVNGGPSDGQWFWPVQVEAHGRPWNAGTGYCTTGAEAKQAVEDIVGTWEA
jgi:hypothetical protein